MSENVTYTEEEKQQFSERSRARMKEITDSIETGIQQLFESEKYKQYLTVMSRFHRYSVNNTMLIYMQDPQATHVAGYEKWRKDFGRQVRGGAKAIKIIAPTPITKTVEKMKWDDEHNRPFFDENGEPIMEEREVRIPRFKVVSVFDVRQTRGRPLPQLAGELSGNVEQYELFLEALKRTSPVPIRFAPLSGDMDSYYSRDDKEIVLREGMSEVQTICAAIHEMGHAKLHDYEKLAAEKGQEVQPKDRRTEEVEAESISYSVCKYYGIDTGENSFGYIAGWSQGKELKELKASLETINRTANHLIYNIDKNFREIAKERGLEAKAQDEQAAPDEYLLYSTALRDHMDQLFQQGKLGQQPPSMSRQEMITEYAVLLRGGDFKSARDLLTDVAKFSGEPVPSDLLARLEALSDQWDAGLIYQLEPALEDGRSLILASHPTEGEPVSQGVIFSGPTERCQELLEQLENGEITARAVRELSRQQELAEQLPERSQLLLVNGVRPICTSRPRRTATIIPSMTPPA